MLCGMNAADTYFQNEMLWNRKSRQRKETAHITCAYIVYKSLVHLHFECAKQIKIPAINHDGQVRWKR
jgi:hypothetical protein